MIEHLSVFGQKDWLLNLSVRDHREGTFPLTDVLSNSLYYPAAGIDVDPIKWLAGNLFSFVYVDYAISQHRLERTLTTRNFRGYELLSQRDVNIRELSPGGWAPLPLDVNDGDPEQYRDAMQPPFCLWLIFQRSPDFDDSHGPYRFSLLYLCADGVATYQAIYTGNRIAPLGVAIIQPGTGFGLNWTDFRDTAQIFARTVRDNAAGEPKLLLYGGIGQEGYEQACWPSYDESVCFLDKTGGGRVGVWQQSR